MKDAKSLLTELTKTQVDFDVDDALRDLSGLGIVHADEQVGKPYRSTKPSPNSTTAGTNIFSQDDNPVA